MHVPGHNQPIITPPALPAPPPIDPTEALLDSKAGTFVEGNVGDLCSLLGIAGALTIALTHRKPSLERIGERVVMGSMAAGATDTAIQGRNLLVDGGEGSRERGNGDSTMGTLAYAATGMIPAVSIAAVRGMHRHPSRAEVAGLALLAVNTGVLGYELVNRVPKIMKGEEDLSGYGSLAASMGGFVVARHLMHR